MKTTAEGGQRSEVKAGPGRSFLAAAEELLQEPEQRLRGGLWRARTVWTGGRGPRWCCGVFGGH